MKRYAWLLIITGAFSLSTCSKGTSNPEIEKPIQKPIESVDVSLITSCSITSIDQLPWAVSLLSGQSGCTMFQFAKLVKYDYKGGQVFYFENALSSLGICTKRLYNCSGTILIPADSIYWADFFANRKNAIVLWEKLLK